MLRIDINAAIFIIFNIKIVILKLVECKRKNI
jgi:hypothetical protein